MPTFDGSNSLAFFKALYRRFGETLNDATGRRETVGVLLDDCFAVFERNIESAPGLACRGGCASCCAIRVAATAPEILLIARTLRSCSETMRFDLRRKIEAADSATRRLDEQDRMQAALPCPFIAGGLCVIYAVRPLACRGHASYDQQACIDALAGRSSEVPLSALHVTVRSLVQNSMQAALRESGCAWGTYELNQALGIALADDACEEAWLRGDDVFAAASIYDVSPEEMAETFDAIKALEA